MQKNKINSSEGEKMRATCKSDLIENDRKTTPVLQLRAATPLLACKTD